MIQYASDYNAWYNLSFGVGLKTPDGKNYSQITDPATTTVTNLICPQFNLLEDRTDSLPCLHFIGLTTGTTQYYYFEPHNYLFDGSQPERDPLKAVDALAIDTKLDDGKPATGIIVSSYNQ